MAASQIVTVATLADLAALAVPVDSFLSNKTIGIVGASASFSPSGQAQIAVVFDLAELAALSVAAAQSGKTVAIVSSTGRMFYLDDSGTPDGTNIVAASDGRSWVAAGQRYYLVGNTGQPANGTSLIDASDGRQWVQF